MTKNEYTLVIILAVLFIISVIGNFYLYRNSNLYLETEEKAFLDVRIYDWGFNLYNEDELLFDYWITNYGDVEGKSIKVNCELADEEGIYFSAIDSYGNLASRSVEFGEFTPKKTTGIDMEKEYSAYCHIESCDNCEILYKRIPGWVESYDGVSMTPSLFP